MENMKYLTDRKIIRIPEDVTSDILISRIVEYSQSNIKIKMVMG